MNEQVYPLAWPSNWKRTPSVQRQPARFRTRERNQVTVAEAVDRLDRQLELIGATSPVLSTNVTLTLRRMPKSDRPDDPGVAVYFTRNRQRLVMPCDRWSTVADNIAAIAAHIDCIRGIERYGVGTLEEAFRGYRALPDPTVEPDWRDMLGPCETLAAAVERFRELSMTLHPDRNGGHDAQFKRLSLAIVNARKFFGGT